MAEEDPYQYTTVTIEAPKKPKKEKDLIFCTVFILIMFAIIADQLILYTFKSADLNVVEQQYIRPMQAKSKYMSKQFVRGKHVTDNLKDDTIPDIDRMANDLACLSFDTKTPERRIDSLEAFSGYTSRINNVFTAFESVQIMNTETMDMTKQIKFIGNNVDEDGRLNFEVNAGTVNPIGKWSAKACFLARGVESPEMTGKTARRLAKAARVMKKRDRRLKSLRHKGRY